MASMFENTQGYDDARRKMAMALIMQGMDTSPIKSWTQGAARIAQALAGNIQLGRLEDEQQAGNKFLLDALKQQASPAPVAAPQVSAPAPQPDVPIPGPTMVPTDQGGTVPLPQRNPLAGLDPEMRTKFADLRNAAAEQGAYFNAPPPGSIGGLRTQPQQDALYAQGRTAPGPIVTGTRNSNHLTGRALDVVPVGTDEGTIGRVVTALTQNDPRFAGMRSGATFSNLNDPLHVELNQPQGAVATGPYDAGLPPGATPAQFTGNGSSGAPAQAPSPQANTPIPPLKLPEMVQKVLDNPKQYPSGIVSAATNMAKYLYEQQITSQRAIETELGKLRAQNSPEIVGLEATKKGSLTTAEEEAKLNPRFRAARADEAGQKKEAELKAEVAPDILLGKSQGHYLNTQAEHQAKLDVGQAQQKKTTAANAGYIGGLVNEAIKSIDAHPNYSTGLVGQYTKGVEASPAGQLDAMLNGIKARIGFEELNKMRAASATGGALGSVSDFENKLLASVYGGISTGLPADALKARLRKLERVYNAVVNEGPEAAAKAYYAEEKAGPTGTTKSGVKWSVD